MAAKHFMTVERRVDGASFSIRLGRDDRFLLWNWSIVVLVNGHQKMHKLKFVYWTIPETGRTMTRKSYTIKPTNLITEFHDYCVNGDYILLKYTSLSVQNFKMRKQEELWRMADPAPIQIGLPNVHSFCSEKEFTNELIDHGTGWLFDTNKNSQFLVKACRTKIQIEDAYFVLVFTGFDAPKFLHEIITTAYRSFDLHLTVVGENKHA